jgi:hypothetical protein
MPTICSASSATSARWRAIESSRACLLARQQAAFRPQHVPDRRIGRELRTVGELEVELADAP